MPNDVINNYGLRSFVPADVYTATVSGAAVNVKDFNGRAAFTLDSALGTGTTPTLDVTIEASADGSTGWTALPVDVDGNAQGVFTQVTDAALAFEKVALDLEQLDDDKPYLRVVGTIAGTTPSFAFGVTAVLPGAEEKITVL